MEEETQRNAREMRRDNNLNIALDPSDFGSCDDLPSTFDTRYERMY